ncbi:MAG: ribonuclease HII [Candidatus Woesearchaeota archaeon]|nr:MAG: ribonuclease HII [Candidatus Woesearchaeota archaeon]
MIVGGIDEAGRGPVIGPMVMALVECPELRLAELKELGVKDSKLLSPRQREEIYEVLVRDFDVHKIILHPQDIDAALTDPSMNLNKLEAKASASLLAESLAEKVILDCPSVNQIGYLDQLRTFTKVDKELIAEHKADEKYVIVGAASIIAKVTRDRIIDELKKKIGIDFGSGYPSDPKTIAFIKAHYKDFDFFRKTWKTYKNAAQKMSLQGFMR